MSGAVRLLHGYPVGDHRTPEGIVDPHLTVEADTVVATPYLIFPGFPCPDEETVNDHSVVGLAVSLNLVDMGIGGGTGDCQLSEIRIGKYLRTCHVLLRGEKHHLVDQAFPSVDRLRSRRVSRKG